MLRAILLSLIAGYADAIGYIDFNAFAGLMTGNTIFFGIEVATAKYDRAMFHALIIVVFLVGVVLARLAVRAGARSWMVLTVTAILLAACSFANAVSGPILLALGMGLQNSAANRFNGVALNHVFITGNLQKLGEEIVHWLWPTKEKTSHGAGIFAAVWAGYAIGALLGALASSRLGMPLLVPAAILPFVMMGAEQRAE
jgi:uncharacterized membrane protein YoaK (UPF0700 family)